MPAPDWYLNQVSLTVRTRGKHRFPGVRSIDLRQSLGSWSHLWSLNNVSGCGSTSLVLVQGLTKVSDQSRALEDRNDSNNP